MSKRDNYREAIATKARIADLRAKQEMLLEQRRNAPLTEIGRLSREISLLEIKIVTLEKGHGDEPYLMRPI